MRLTPFEGFMGVALLVLLCGFVFPRVVQGSPEVRQSQAVALQLKIQSLYEEWHTRGGTHGPGEVLSKRSLTRNMLECLTSPVNRPYVSTVITKRNLGAAGVYERPTLNPSPSSVRLSNFSGKLPDVTFTTPKGKPCEGVLLAGSFGVCFDGRNWEVVPIF